MLCMGLTARNEKLIAAGIMPEFQIFALAPATQVRFLLREEPDALGENKITWVGALPLRWREQEISRRRTIGYFADAVRRVKDRARCTR